MPSRRSGIIAAIVALLDQPEKPAGVAIERFTTGQSPHARRITVYWVAEQLKRSHGSQFGDSQVRETTVRLVLVSTRAEGQAADDATDDLEVWAVQQLMRDPTLDGRVADVEPAQVVLDLETFETTRVRSFLDLIVTHDTDLADPRALPGGPPDEGA